MIPPDESGQLSHHEIILEITGTPKVISLSVKEFAERLIADRGKLRKTKEKFLVVNVLLRKETWHLVCGVGNINFQGCHVFYISLFTGVIFHSPGSYFMFKF